MSRPRLLFYCQHALGLGHLVRSLALAGGLAERFDVVLLNGGRLPEGTTIPAGVQLVNLPPLGYDPDFGLVSHDPNVPVGLAQELRVQQILDLAHRVRPDVLVIELYPFGRNKFAYELEPLLDAVAAGTCGRPVVVCSLRDLLVDERDDQAKHDDRVVRRANGRFDAVLVHADATFARLDDSFHPTTPLRVPVHHTGFVVPDTGPAPDPASLRLDRVLVSAGGGVVGGPLFDVAAAAAERLAEHGLSTTIIAGPFLPDAEWEELRARATRSPALEVVRRVDDLRAEMARSVVSVSQCGYNTAMDVLRAGIPAIVVPFSDGRENEQTRRADRLRARGVLTSIPSDQLTADRLVDEVTEIREGAPAPAPAALDLTGRETSVRIVAELAGLDTDPRRDRLTAMTP